jgi:hypothetical protein
MLKKISSPFLPFINMEQFTTHKLTAEVDSFLQTVGSKYQALIDVELSPHHKKSFAKTQVHIGVYNKKHNINDKWTTRGKHSAEMAELASIMAKNIANIE